MIKRKFPYLGFVVGAAISVAGAAQPVVGAEPGKCIEDWAEAAAIVKAGQMMDVSDLSKIARDKYAGRIMTARLCSGDRGYFYRLVIRDDEGRARQVTIQAENPNKKSVMRRD